MKNPLRLQGILVYPKTIKIKDWWRRGGSNPGPTRASLKALRV